MDKKPTEQKTTAQVVAKHENGGKLTYAEEVIWYKELARLIDLSRS